MGHSGYCSVIDDVETLKRNHGDGSMSFWIKLWNQYRSRSHLTNLMLKLIKGISWKFPFLNNSFVFCALLLILVPEVVVVRIYETSRLFLRTFGTERYTTSSICSPDVVSVDASITGVSVENHIPMGEGIE